MDFHTIMPFRPSNPEMMAEEYLRFHRETSLDLLLPSMALNPEGDDPYVKADRFIAAFAELRERLRGSGIRLGVLLQALVGHGWSSYRPAQGFQLTVNDLGEHSGRTCPSDPGFLEYCRHTVAGLARLGPVLFLLDDDTRLLNNARLECFCPRHLAMFSRPYTREELVRLLLASHQDSPIVREYEAIRRDSLEKFCANVRQAIDSVDPAIPCGLSGAGREQVMYERMALAASGPATEAFVRVANGLYGETSAKDLPRQVYRTSVQIKACGKVRKLLDEADTYPQHRYSKSVVGMHSHLTSALLHGLTGAKLWIANFANFGKGEPNHGYERHFREYAGFYDELTRAVRDVEWLGPSVPLPNLEKNFHPREYADYFTCQEWFSDALGRMGLPVTFREPTDPKATCFLLTGELLNHFTDEERQAIARRNLLLDASAAESLNAQGLAGLTGVELSECPHFSTERDCESGLALRLLYSPKCRRLTPAPGAKVCSVLQSNPYAGSAVGEQRTVAPGSVLFDNGKTKVATWAGRIDWYTVSPERKLWLTRILRELADIPAVCLNEQDLLGRCGRRSDGRLLLALINLNFDALRDIRLSCQERPDEIRRLTPGGEWLPVDFRLEGSTVLLDPGVRCPAYAPLILELSVK
ncbi:MAG: hypothetical protein IJJ33_11135 [Victivallales bacterium]|nr:hypothetical protein [Victivallales bacterium]